MIHEKREREVAVPLSTLVSVRRALEDGEEPTFATLGLSRAGFEAGEEASALLERELGGARTSSREGGIGSLELEQFWKEFSAFWRRRGWGRLEHETAHPGVGLLFSSDWAEAEAWRAEGRSPGCTFSSGMLAGTLSGVAGGGIAVLEVSCRARGSERCAFAYGAEPTIARYYEQLLDGSSPERALAAL